MTLILLILFKFGEKHSSKRLKLAREWKSVTGRTQKSCVTLLSLHHATY